MDVAILHRSNRHAFLARSAALFLLLLAGCVRETTEGTASTFRYELWVPISAFLGGLVAVPAGLALRHKSARYGWVLIILGPLAVVFVAPSLMLDRVIVDDAGFHSRTGVWGMTSVHDVKLADAGSVRIIAETSTTKRGKQTNYFFLCQLKSGGTVKFPVNNEVVKAAAPKILDRLRAHGVPVTNETGE